MFAQFKAYIAGGIAALILGLGITVWIQHERNENLSDKVYSLSSANANNDKTIQELKKDINSGNKTCNQLVADLNKTIRNFKKIDNSTEPAYEQNSVGTLDSKGSGSSNGPDPLLDLLNGMLQADYREGIH